MVKIGDQVYHWRYGALIVTRLEGNYIYADLLDPGGIVDAGEGRDILGKTEKVFLLGSFGHWLHDTPKGAILKNNNAISFSQGQEPKAMRFPIRGHLFHRSFKTILEEYNNLRRSIAEIESELSSIPNKYGKYKKEYQKVVDEFLFNLKELIAACPSAKRSEDIARISVLKVLRNLSENLSIEECASKVKAEGKKEFDNDADYKEYTLWVEELVQKLSDKLDDLKKKANEIKESAKIEKLINEQGFCDLMKGLLNEEQRSDDLVKGLLDKILDEEMAIEKSEYDSKRKELEKSIKEYGKLSDPSYVIF